jgi:hypothetical protein
MSWIPTECDRCDRPQAHRPDEKTTAVLTGRNYLCDQHYDEAVAIYESRETEVKAKLVIDPCCTSCGIAGDVRKPMVIESQHCEHRENCHHGHNHCLFNEDCEHCDHSGPGEYSTFFKAMLGQTVQGRETVIDATVTNAGLKTNAYGQIVAAGHQGQFCSMHCLAMDLFLYRNRRCAGCAQHLAKKDWISPERSQSKAAYPKYRYCGEPCQKRWHSREGDILTAEHVMAALGAVNTQGNQRQRASKKAKDLVWQQKAA